MKKYIIYTDFVIVFIIFCCNFLYCGTALFNNDLDKSKKYLDEEVKAIKKFLEVLSQEDVEFLNSRGARSGRLSPQANIELQNLETNYGGFGIYGRSGSFASSRCPETKGICPTFLPKLGDAPVYMADINFIIKEYGINSDEEQYVVTELFKYLLKYLYYLQELTDITKEKKLENTEFLELRYAIFTSPPSDPQMQYQEERDARLVIARIVLKMLESGKNKPQLYQNETFLNCEKAWIDFAMNINATKKLKWEDNEEELIKELEYIKKLQAEEKKPETVKKAEKTEPEKTTTKPDETNKFRLDLPK